MDSYFPSSYEDSRTRFMQSLSLIQQKWHSTQLETNPLKNFPDISIDWLWAQAPKKETLVIISTAEHGIEGYVGYALMKIFIEEFAPRYQMSIIMSPLDPMTSEETSKKFNYPLVLKINAQEFYDISGDMAAYYYKLRNKNFSDRHLFACGFEFGTFGSSLPARIRSLRAMVFENQLHWHGAKNARIVDQVRKEFDEFYFPSETIWREKALADGRQAFEGILHAYQLI